MAQLVSYLDAVVFSSSCGSRRPATGQEWYFFFLSAFPFLVSSFKVIPCFPRYVRNCGGRKSLKMIKYLLSRTQGGIDNHKTEKPGEPPRFALPYVVLSLQKKKKEQKNLDIWIIYSFLVVRLNGVAFLIFHPFSSTSKDFVIFRSFMLLFWLHVPVSAFGSLYSWTLSFPFHSSVRILFLIK